jgi:hypothetical protein
VSNLIYNLPKSLQRRDFHTLQVPPLEGFREVKVPPLEGFREVKVPPLEGFREVKVDKRQNEMHPI